jgi:hypothetical protein
MLLARTDINSLGKNHLADLSWRISRCQLKGLAANVDLRKSANFVLLHPCQTLGAKLVRFCRKGETLIVGVAIGQIKGRAVELGTCQSAKHQHNKEIFQCMCSALRVTWLVVRFGGIPNIESTVANAPHSIPIDFDLLIGGVSNEDQ